MIKKIFFLIINIAFVACNQENTNECLSEDLFLNPPSAYNVQTWYHWQNGHISKERITQELEEMQNHRISGFTVFNVAEGIPEGPVKFMSSKWWEIFNHTKKEAARLGLEMSIMNCAGWSATAGPWVTPDKAMQEVVWTEKYVKGPADLSVKLEMPVPVLGLTRDMKKDSVINRRYYVSRNETKGYYRDIVVLAYPSMSDEEKGEIYHINDWIGKTGRNKMYQYVKDTKNVPDGKSIQLSEVIDITDKLDKDGFLRWNVPDGKWTILRIGYQPTGRQNHPAPPAGRGLEIDKMSKEALDLHWDNFVKPMIEKQGIKYLLLDSYEAGHQNWTSGFESEFKRICGYDLMKYLPCITGRVVESTDVTERFLWDFRKVINELIIDNYYKHYSELCHLNGIKLAAEHYGNFGNINDFDAGEFIDIPAAEFWALNNNNHAGTAKLASSTAHLYGHSVVGAEAFSGMPQRIFETNPRDIKSQCDLYFTQGINQFWLHGFTHDPYGVSPGISLGCYGSNFNNRNTWWDYSNEWFLYLSRCQYMLQNGISANDILYFAGEDSPLRAEGKFKPIIPYGYDYDLCNKDILENLSVVKGRIVTHTGMEYKLLVVRDLNYLSLETLKTIRNLVKSGAIVLMRFPEDSPSLKYDKNEYEKILNELKSYSNLYSKHKVIEICNKIKMLPDFEYRYIDNKGFDSHIDDSIKYIHRKNKYEDIYFVHNMSKSSKVISAIFRMEGKYPEIWNPLNGSVQRNLEYQKLPDGRISVIIRFEDEGSAFVVFKDEKTSQIINNNEEISPVNYSIESISGKNYFSTTNPGKYSFKIDDKELFFEVPEFDKNIDLSEDWCVVFKDTVVNMNKLYDWKDSNLSVVKSFSGTATYKKKIHFNQGNNENLRYILDLGRVEIVAKVRINGVNISTLWRYPYQLDITDYLKEGLNELEIDVANLWVNRIIYDYKLDEDCEWTSDTGSTSSGYSLKQIPNWVLNNANSPTGRTSFVIWKWPHLKDKEPISSGLIGPVKLFSKYVYKIK